MATKRKNHNLTKRVNRSSQLIVKQHNIAVLYSYNDQQRSSLINIKRGNGIKPTPLLIKTVSEVPFKWTVFIAGLCLDETGTKYMKCEEIQAKEFYCQYDLADYLSERHSELLRGCNNKHLINAMWLACPYEHSSNEEEAFKLF